MKRQQWQGKAHSRLLYLFVLHNTHSFLCVYPSNFTNFVRHAYRKFPTNSIYLKKLEFLLFSTYITELSRGVGYYTARKHCKVVDELNEARELYCLPNSRRLVFMPFSFFVFSFANSQTTTSQAKQISPSSAQN